MQAKKVIALKRIANDMKELAKCPLEGIGIASIENDPMKFVVNMELMAGPYEGYKVQLLMTMNDEYPIKPPEMQIFPDQLIVMGFHSHIFLWSNNYMGFCIKLLEKNFSMNINEQYTGWNPAYTISSILLQVQNFIGDPDMHQNPSKSSIKRLMKSMNSYKRTFIIKDEEGEKKVVHTWKDPYPKMYRMKNQMEEEENEVIEKKDKLERKQEVIKENLTCYLLRDNYIENSKVLLGYPIIKNQSAYRENKIQLYPIPQLLTYEAYKMQKSEVQPYQSQLIGSYYITKNQVKVSYKVYYNYWLPIYVDEYHYRMNREVIINSLKAIKNESEFRPEQIFEILPIILNKMIIGILNGKSIISSSFIICYFQYVLLFKRLCGEYKEKYEEYVNRKISLIKNNDYEVNKKNIPTIGDFFMLIYLSNKDMSTTEMKKIEKVLIEEFLIRQMYWMFHGPEYETMKSKVVNSSLKVKDEAYLEKFQKDPYFKIRFLDIFVKELHKQDIYHQMIDIISNDKNYLWNYHNNRNYAKRMAEKGISRSFKKIYNQCIQSSKDRINDLIREKMHFSEFFQEEDERMVKDEMYESYQVDEILKGGKESSDTSDILAYAYESQKGNHLLLITFLVLKKLKEKGFMEELKKSYGIYLGVDAFLKEIKQKLKEIKSFKSLYQFIGTDLGQDKTEMELIMESYEKAKKRGYIWVPNENQRMNNQNQFYQSSSYRGNQYRGQRNGYGYGNQYWYNQRQRNGYGNGNQYWYSQRW
jgi:ubiquitin-protein ligase